MGKMKYFKKNCSTKKFLRFDLSNLDRIAEPEGDLSNENDTEMESEKVDEIQDLDWVSSQTDSESDKAEESEDYKTSETSKETKTKAFSLKNIYKLNRNDPKWIDSVIEQLEKSNVNIKENELEQKIEKELDHEKRNEEKLDHKHKKGLKHLSLDTKNQYIILYVRQTHNSIW